MAQNDINIKVKVDASQAEKATTNYRHRVRELMDAMTALQLAGKENTAEYKALANELGVIKDAMSDTAAQARILSDDFFKQQAAMEGLSVGINVFSGLTQAAALCGIENEDLQETLVKLQAAQNLANTAMNISKALNKDTALMVALNNLKTKLLTSSIEAETKAQKALNIAKKASLGIIGALVVAIGPLVKAYIDARDAQANFSKELQSRSAEGYAKAISNAKSLTAAYNNLGDDLNAKKKFFEDHRDVLGEISNNTKSVADYDKQFIEQTAKYVEAQKLRAKANAAQEMAEELIKEQLKIENLRDRMISGELTTMEQISLKASQIDGAIKEWILGEQNYNTMLERTNKVYNERETEIQKLYNLSADLNAEADKLNSPGKSTDTPVKELKQTLTEVKPLVEDLDAEMEQAMKGVDWRTEKEKSDEFWNSLLFNMDEYQQKGEEIDRESLAWAEQQDEEYKKILQREKDIREAKLATLSTISQATQAVSGLLNSLMENELQQAEGNEKKQADIRKKYARAQFALQVGDIISSTAKAIMETWSAYSGIPFVGQGLAIAQSAIIGSTGAAQLVQAKTAMDKALSGKAARGAFIRGRSHAEGGELWELEGGEAVLNKDAMAVPAFRALASAMNESTGGVAFDNILSSGSNNSKSLISASVSEETIQRIVSDTVAGIVAIPVVVTENNITTAQRNVSVINSRSTF